MMSSSTVFFEGIGARDKPDQLYVRISASNTEYQSYSDNSTAVCTTIVAVCFFIVAVAFFVYDRFVQQRNMQLLGEAARINGLVTSLFPSSVHERLFKTKTPDAEEIKVAKNAPKKKKANKDKTGNDIIEASDAKVSNELDSMPIADLFPHTTILFSDLAGFTAWSSTREPAHVFILLETIYGAFDEIAKRYVSFLLRRPAPVDPSQC